MKKIILFTFCFLLLLPFSVKAETGTAETDIVIKAMQDEMKRSMKSLKIEKMEKPYYLEYTIVDLRQISIEAGFGALLKSGESHQRILKVDVRVGDYRMDNTGFIGRGNIQSAVMSPISGNTDYIVLEDDYNVLRHDIWIATDRVYKQAVEQLAEKRAFIRNQVQTDKVPDFSKEEPLRTVSPDRTIKIDKKKWQKIVKNLSTIFRRYPAIYESYVELQVYQVHKYYVNSEGTVFRQPQTLTSLLGLAVTQSADGMKLKHYVPYYAASVDQLPVEKELSAGIRQMAEELTRLTTAPVLDGYIGPVLFMPHASAELFSQVFLPHLSGQHPPLSSMPHITQIAPSSRLLRRINRKVLPRSITIIDDPTLTHFGKVPLIGSYVVDDQGVKAKPIKLVENGILKTLLMSRRPGKLLSQSNGHGRAALMGIPGAQVGNLIITADKGKARKELRKRFLQMCKEQQLPYGLIIKTFDNPAITGLDEGTSARLMQNPQNPLMTTPVLVYRVYVKDGREELVRGINVAELTVNDLKYISAVGNDTTVYNRLVAPTGGIMNYLYSYFSSGSGGGLLIPVSIAAPSLLFEEVEFEKVDAKRDKPPIMPHPFFTKKNREP